MNFDEKQALISAALLTKAGRRSLAQAMARPGTRCVVCGQPYGDFIAHCDAAGDPEHLAASVMET